MTDASPDAPAMDREALQQAQRLLDAALREPSVPAKLAHQAHQALQREQHRLRGAGLACQHLDATRLACAQLAAGLGPGRLKLAACRQILQAHLAGHGGAG